MSCHGIRITILNLIYFYIYNLYWVHCHCYRCRPSGQTTFILLLLHLSLNVVSEPQSLFLIINLHCHFFRCIRAHTQDVMGISSIPRLLISAFRSSQNRCFSITHTLRLILVPIMHFLLWTHLPHLTCA